MKKIFGKRLKEQREKANEYQIDLAQILKVDKSMISKWEHGINYPDVKTLIEIAEHYQISTDYLLGLNNNPKPNPQNIKQTNNFNFNFLGDNK